MKTAYIPAACGFLLLLAGCVGMPVESAISACPGAGLEEVAFTAGPPASGDIIAPVEDDGGKAWHFGDAEGGVYLRCVYDDGYERLQKLPRQMQSCRRKDGGQIMCRSLI